MKKKILSLLLAFAIVFSVFIPVNILPETKIVADAEEGSYPYNVYDSEVHVGSYEELETAVKNAIDNQIIILETDIYKVNPSYNYGNLDFTVNGTVAIDLNGCSINLGPLADYVFNIKGATKLHIMNSRIDENDSTISLKGINKGRSVIQVANSSAELFVYEGIELVLEKMDGAYTSGDPAVIRVKNVARLDLLCNIKALDAESNGIVFEKVKLLNNRFANSKIYIRGHYDDSDVNTYIKADAACIKFVDINPGTDVRTAFKVTADTFNIFKLGCDLFKADTSKKGAMISVDSSSTLTVNDICLAGGTFIPAGRVYLTGNITSFSDEDFYSIKYHSAELKTCPHKNTDEFKAEKLLSTPDSHIDMCKCKGATIFSGHDRNSEMGCNGCELNTLDTEMTVPVVDEIIEVDTYKELYNALRSNKSDITIRLTANITAYDDVVSGNRVQSINLSVFGNVVIDLNGYYLDVSIAESKPLFVIYKNYCNSEGALNLIITSFAPGYNYILNRSSEVVHLSNENVSVTAYGVDLSVDEFASEGTSVIKATKFKNLNVFEDSKIFNVVGSAISFDNSSSQAYENSSVDLSCCDFKTKKAAISLNGNPFKKNTFKKFSLGLSEFDTFDYEGDKLQIFDCAVNPDVKWSDLIRHWVENEENRGYFLYGNNNKLISSAADDANITKKFDYAVSVYASSLDASSLCSEAKDVAIIVNGNTVYAYCEICGQFGAHTVEAGAYESPNCTKEGKLDHFRCVDNNCGVYFNSEYMGVTAEDIILPKHSSTVLSDWRGFPQVFPASATCTAPGLPEDCYYCFVCENYVSPDGRIVEEVPASHKLDFVKATVTCKHEGTIDHYHCSVCSKNFSDSEGKNELASINCNPDLSFYHKFDSNPATEADCINYGIKYKHGICEHCDKLIVMIPGKLGTFSYEVFDEAKHTTPAGHKYAWVETRPAEVGKPGEQAYQCSVCKAVNGTKPIPALEPEYKLGDVNGDNNITAADARLTLRYSVDLEVFTEIMKKAAEVDGKPEKITAADARMILRASVDLEKLG